MSFFAPTPTADTSFFWEGCKNEELRFQKCKNCGYVRWPASIACPKCHSMDYDYIISEGIGKIYSFVVYMVAFHEAFANTLPYIVAVVELEEGPHILSNIIDADPAKLQCDIPVKLVWDKHEGFNIPKFALFER